MGCGASKPAPGGVRVSAQIGAGGAAVAVSAGAQSKDKKPDEPVAPAPAAEEPAKESSKEPAKEPEEEPSKEPEEEPAKEPAEEPAKEPEEEPSKEPAEEPAKEPEEEPSKEPAEEPAAEVPAAAAGESARIGDGSQLGSLAAFVPPLVVEHVEQQKDKAEDLVATRYPDATLLVADVSGFTALSERFSAIGAEGSEQVATFLTTFYARLMDMAASWGGQCVKIAGDALLLVFLGAPSSGDGSDEEKVRLCRAASECGYVLAQETFEAHGVTLTLHCAVASGAMTAFHLKLGEGDYEFFLSGGPFEDIAAPLNASKKGELVVTKGAHALIEPFFQTKAGGKAAFGNYYVLGAKSADDGLERYKEDAHFGDVVVSAGNLEHLTGYLPKPAEVKINSKDWLGELRTVSVLFVAMRGIFRDRKGMDQHIRRSHTTLVDMQKLVAARGGYRRQFLLDDKGAVMIIVFGVPPFAHEDDAARAVQLASELHETLQGTQTWHRIGIATGRAYTGPVGHDTRMEHMVVGDVVNSSARLAFHKSGGITLDTATKEAASATIAFDFSSAGTAKLKGKKNPVSVWKPIGIKRRLSVLLDPSTTFVGRQAEVESCVARIKAHVDAWSVPEDEDDAEAGDGASARKSFVTLVSSIMGGGKTAFVGKVLQGVQSEDPEGVAFFVGGGRDSEVTPSGAPRDFFSAIKGILAQILDLDDDSLSVQDKVDILNVTCEELEDPELRLCAPLVAEVMGIATDESNDFVDSLHPVKEKPEVVQKVLTTLVSQGIVSVPPVIVVEDTHNVDGLSWALLEEIARAVGPAFILTRRSETEPIPAFTHFVETVATGDDFCKIDLESFSASELGQLAEARLQGAKLDDASIEWLLETSLGNPLFCVQLLQMLAITEGAIETTDDESKASKINLEVLADKVPNSVQSMVTYQLDQLGPEKRVVQMASVLGRAFMLEALKELIEADNKESPSEAASMNLEELLAGLSKDIFQSKKRNDELVFAHALFQKASYENLAGAQRRRLHAVAAQLAAGRNDVTTAADHAYLAVESLPDPDQEALAQAIELQIKAMRAYLGYGEFDTARVYVDRSRELADALAEGPVREELQFVTNASTGTWYMSKFGGPHPEAVPFMKKADLIARELPHDVQRPLLGLVYMMRVFFCLLGDYGSSCIHALAMEKYAKTPVERCCFALSYAQCQYFLSNPNATFKMHEVCDEAYDQDDLEIQRMYIMVMMDVRVNVRGFALSCALLTGRYDYWQELVDKFANSPRPPLDPTSFMLYPALCAALCEAGMVAETRKMLSTFATMPCASPYWMITRVMEFWADLVEGKTSADDAAAKEQYEGIRGFWNMIKPVQPVAAMISQVLLPVTDFFGDADFAKEICDCIIDAYHGDSGGAVAFYCASRWRAKAAGNTDGLEEAYIRAMDGGAHHNALLVACDLADKEKIEAAREKCTGTIPEAVQKQIDAALQKE